MFDILKIKLIAMLRSFQHACPTPVLPDDDGDHGNIATPKLRP